MGRPCSSKNEGIALVNKCSINKSTNVSSKKVQIESATLVRPSKFSLIPRSFNIILLIDTQEVKGKVKDDVVSQLTREKINFEIRHLHVGDFLWIAQCRRTRQELVLPYIIERKRIDDFAASMKDGRYGEQKFRLKKSGIPNIVYMIEQLPHGTTNNSIPEANILQAAVNSIIHHGFFVKDTSSHRDSLLYLATFTKNLVELFKDKLLIQCDKNSLPDKINFDAEEISLMDFKQFNESSMKLRALDVQQMFMKQLLPIRGLAPEGILTILQYYKSPMALKKALDDAGPGAVALLTSLQSVRTKRRLGPILAKKIYQFYTQGFLR
ncbi:crossover junction endonuclease MUS81 [Fopius arisanus]|uniref:Crossover junction endonuclease MUS81 n=2 Tax=Fopius arisanus TaxID=64838 RepID=A0A9R1UAG2_9HYME|nr:PREDICTED: crossover junction endonuclease MUS81 [Fopius arisanus]